MKFQLVLNIERNDDQLPMTEVLEHILRMVKLADQGGFHIVWAAEHHGLEMNIAPDPFQILTWWSAHTKNIRLGTAVAVAAYWHPLKLAGVAAMLDQISGGRLEFGIGSGAYQREFDRMRPGLKQSDAYLYMQEMLPAVRALWEGDYTHEGRLWSFPRATSVPKPLQVPHPPVWVAARSPITFDYAVANNCNIISWPLTRPFSEAELYRQQLDDAMEKHGVQNQPAFAMMRHTALYRDSATRQHVIDSLQASMGLFENLFRNLDDVQDGFPKRIPLDELVEREQYDPTTLERNLMFGKPEDVVDKLGRYQELGVDQFVYLASMGLDLSVQFESLQMFCEEVIPHFAA